MKTKEELDQLGTSVLGLAIEVHKILGPGLLESSYEKALCYELSNHKIPFQRQLKQPVFYKGVKLESDYILDILVDDSIILELKCVEQLQPIHHSQLLTYLRNSQKQIGYLINFNVDLLKNGIKRKIISL